MPENFPFELLAAYADGELDADTAAAVDRWLADHPEALPCLNAQREFSPMNAGLWEYAAAPEPSAASWDAVRRNIEIGLNKPAAPARADRRLTAWLLGGVAAAALAASVAWFAFGPVPQPGVGKPVSEVIAKNETPAPGLPTPDSRFLAPAPRAAKPDLLAEFAVLEMASDDDVILERVPDTRRGWLPIGRHPLPDTLALATIDEVDLPEVEPIPVWPFSVPKMQTPPGHAPMIFAAKPR